MMNKFYLLIIIIVLICTKVYSSNNIFIALSINEEIITNHDLNREASYLKILNPQLKQLSKKKLNEIAKNSLTNEIIKKNELSKFFELDKDVKIIEKIFKDFFKNLGFANLNEFENSLLKNITYTSSEIKDKMKIEFFWNSIILEKYNDLVKIDKNKLIEKIKNSDEIKTEYLLSEIFFTKEKGLNINQQINKIMKSISDVGFNNTASIFSKSESANLGGKIGWVEEESLSQKIIDELKKIKVKEFTNAIQFGNNFLILKIEDKKNKKIKLDEKLMLQKMIEFERNKQLNQFSNIYFNKIKVNYIINEK